MSRRPDFAPSLQCDVEYSDDQRATFRNGKSFAGSS